MKRFVTNFLGVLSFLPDEAKSTRMSTSEVSVVAEIAYTFVLTGSPMNPEFILVCSRRAAAQFRHVKTFINGKERPDEDVHGLSHCHPVSVQ